MLSLLASVLIAFGVDANEISHRLNNLPFSIINAITGTSSSPFGGLLLPVDPRFISPLAFPPFLEDTTAVNPPLTNEACYEFWQTNATWLTRAMTKSVIPYIKLISNPSELATFTPQELTCLFYLGFNPTRIPEGRAYGRVLYTLGNPIIKDLAQILWGGKILFKTPCDNGDDSVQICINNFNRAPIAVGQLSISTNIDTIHPNDFIDNNAVWMIDYGAEFKDMCPAIVPRFYDSQGPYKSVDDLRDYLRAMKVPGVIATEFARMILNSHKMPNLVGQPGALSPPAQLNFDMFENGWPLREIFDEIRWVGRDDEFKTDIYLGRALYNFPGGARTVAWFSMKIPDLLDVQIY